MEKVKVVVPGAPEDLSFKPPIQCTNAVNFVQKLYGAGYLCNSDGDVVLENELLAGSYTYHVAGGTGRSDGSGCLAGEKSDSNLEVRKLIDSCKEYVVTGEDTVESLIEYLNDWEPLRGLVPVVNIPSRRKSAFVESRSGFAIAISYFMGQKPTSGRGELVVTANVSRWHAILEQIDFYSPLDKQLGIVLAMDRTESAASTASSSQSVFKKRKRPDYITEVDGRTCLYGELKADADKLSLATSELASKREILPVFVYGSLKFLVCFAAADTKLQFYMHNCITQKVEPLTKTYQLLYRKERTELALVIIKLYFLLLGVKRALSKGFKGLPFYKRTPREFGHIYLEPGYCEKTISNWAAYQRKFKVHFEDLCAAYKSGNRHLAQALCGPNIRSLKKCQVYTVTLGPVGSPVQLTSEEEAMTLAVHLLIALNALHAEDLVHRDVRLDNVIRDSDIFVLIDLELVRKNMCPTEGLMLTDWEIGSLVRNKKKEVCYSKTSDLYQLGVLLEKTQLIQSVENKEFISLLKSHRKTASSILKSVQKDSL